ncbi:hypothetical protein QE152_g30005 [Popillia japonica]|uniref:Uncharacterized protein n=1 Tax=Popillia japonica TaxID=7064 RepID=A0AAW1JG89_POPJA
MRVPPDLTVEMFAAYRKGHKRIISFWFINQMRVPPDLTVEMFAAYSIEPPVEDTTGMRMREEPHVWTLQDFRLSLRHCTDIHCEISCLFIFGYLFSYNRSVVIVVMDSKRPLTDQEGWQALMEDSDGDRDLQMNEVFSDVPSDEDVLEENVHSKLINVLILGYNRSVVIVVMDSKRPLTDQEGWQALMEDSDGDRDLQMNEVFSDVPSDEDVLEENVFLKMYMKQSNPYPRTPWIMTKQKINL